LAAVKDAFDEIKPIPLWREGKFNFSKKADAKDFAKRYPVIENLRKELETLKMSAHRPEIRRGKELGNVPFHLFLYVIP